jgi:RNA polymerase sigma-70 factor (ECF subfamily)
MESPARASSAPGTYSDEQVVDLVLQGQTGTYELLMRRYNQRLFRIARAILKDEDEAREVMQDAYVRAYANLSGFRRESSFATWLTRIAVHQALARARARGLQEPIDETYAESSRSLPMSRPRFSPEEETAQRQLADTLERLIDHLPVPYRSAFVLRHVEGLSVRETAECLQISEETARMRTHRARALLRRYLKERLGVVSSEVFPLHQSICDAVVNSVFTSLQ